MDTTFLSYVLVLCLALLLVLYLSQNKYTENKYNMNMNNNKKDSYLPVIFDTCKNKRTSGMPVHRIGPIKNFHQSFGKYKNMTLNHILSLDKDEGTNYLRWLYGSMLKDTTRKKSPTQLAIMKYINLVVGV